MQAVFFIATKVAERYLKGKAGEESVYEADNETHFKAVRGRVQRAGL